MKKIILITGATSGIGKSVFEKFLYAGWKCIITGRSEEKLSNLIQDIDLKYKNDILPLVMDIQNKEQVFKIISNIPTAWQSIDVCLNNAGLALGKDSFENAIIDDWETMIDTNLKGVIYVSKAVLPYMIKYEKGYFINMGSTAAKDVYKEGNVYCATKAAVDTLSKAMRIDLLSHKIKVTAIHPGSVETNFSITRFKGNTEIAQKVYEGYTPLYPADIADIILYLANTPQNVCINELTVTCLSQAGAHYFQKS